MNGSAPRRGGPATQGRTGRRHDGVSQALRQAYESTVNEDVPDELLDLIRKLN